MTYWKAATTGIGHAVQFSSRHMIATGYGAISFFYLTKADGTHTITRL